MSGGDKAVLKNDDENELLPMAGLLKSFGRLKLGKAKHCFIARIYGNMIPCVYQALNLSEGQRQKISRTVDKLRAFHYPASPPARLAAKPMTGKAGSPLGKIEAVIFLNGASSLLPKKLIASSPVGGSAGQLSKDDKWKNVINSIRNLDTEMKLGVGYAFNETIHYRVQNIASFFDISYQGASQALFELIYDSKPFHEISLRKFAQRLASLSDDDISDRLIGITREIRMEEKAAVEQGLVPGTIKMYAFEKLADETIKILRYLGLRNPVLRALSRRPDEKEKYLAFNVPIFVSAKLVKKFFHELFASHLLPEPPQDRAYEYQAGFGFYDDTKDFQTGLISLALLAISSDTNPLALPVFSPKKKLESYSLFHDFMPTSFFTSVQVAGKGLDFNGSKHDYAFSEKNSGERLSAAELEKKRADTTNIVRFSGPYLIDKWGTELKYLTIYPEYLRHFQPNETMGKRSDFYLIDNLEHIQIIQKLLLVFKKRPLLWQGFVKNMTEHLRGVRINILNRQDDILSHLQNEPLKEYWRAAQMCPQPFYAFKDKNIHTNYYKLTTDREKIIFNPKGLKAYGALCQLVDQLKGHFKSNDRQRILLQECFYQTLEQIGKAKKQKKSSIETAPFFPGSSPAVKAGSPLGDSEAKKTAAVPIFLIINANKGEKGSSPLEKEMERQFSSASSSPAGERVVMAGYFDIRLKNSQELSMGMPLYAGFNSRISLSLVTICVAFASTAVSMMKLSSLSLQTLSFVRGFTVIAFRPITVINSSMFKGLTFNSFVRKTSLISSNSLSETIRVNLPSLKAWYTAKLAGLLSRQEMKMLVSTTALISRIYLFSGHLAYPGYFFFGGYAFYLAAYVVYRIIQPFGPGSLFQPLHKLYLFLNRQLSNKFFLYQLWQ